MSGSEENGIHTRTRYQQRHNSLSTTLDVTAGNRAGRNKLLSTPQQGGKGVKLVEYLYIINIGKSCGIFRH